MKIRYILLLYFFISGISFAMGSGCDYLKNVDGFVEQDQEDQFNYLYNYHYCENTEPLNAEAEEYIQGIKDTEGKSIVELTHEIGNTFCRGYFGDCGLSDKTFHARYEEACAKARDQAIADMPAEKKVAPNNTTFLIDSYLDCTGSIDNLLQAYKETSINEVSTYHKKIIEASNSTYLQKSHEKNDTLTTLWNVFIKKISSIAKQFEGFTPVVYEGGGH